MSVYRHAGSIVFFGAGLIVIVCKTRHLALVGADPDRPRAADVASKYS
jgi:hypothetical protein